MKAQPHSAGSRLTHWGQWIQDPRADIARSTSPFGQIARDKEAAGNHGDGIRYEIIDGTPCPPDGGLADHVERNAGRIMHNFRCKETHEAVAMLPDEFRRVLLAKYVVPGKGKPRSERLVAEKLGLPKTTVHDALTEAHERVAREIYGPFNFAEADQTEEGPEIDEDESAART